MSALSLDPMEELFNGGGHDGLLNWSSILTWMCPIDGRYVSLHKYSIFL